MIFLFRNPRFLVLTLLLLVFVGIASFQLLPNAEDPELVPRFVSVMTRWPGANAQRVDSLVTEKIEQKLEEVEELKELNSVSRAGYSFVGVAFKDNVNGERLERAVTRVQEKLSQVQPELPAGASIPELNDNFIGTITMITAITWNDDSPVQPVLLTRYAEELSDLMRRIPGTNFVQLFGQAREEIIVDADPDHLNHLGLSPAQLAEKIQSSDAKVAAGQIQNERSELIIEVDGEFETLDQIRRIPIATASDGRVVWLSDIASVTKGIADPPRELALIGGRRGVAVAAQMEIENRIEDWTAATYRALERYEQQLPAGIELEVLFEQNQYTQRRLADLKFNLVLGVLLVLVATLVMMGWRSSIVVATALPLSILMTLAGMKIIGLGIHQMSILGLIIALGLLIDNAIIIVDEITRKLNANVPTDEAITASIRHLGLPLMGSTLTTVLAFAPLALMPGPVGDFCRALALTVILALSSSLFVSLTLIPILVGIINRWKHSDFNGLKSSPFLGHYRSILSGLFRCPVVPIVCVPGLSLLGFYCATMLAQEFFPFSDRDHFPIQMRIDASGSLDQSRQMAEAVRERIIAHDEVDDVHWFVGGNSPKFFYSMGGGSNGSPSVSQGIVQLRHTENLNEFIIDLQRELDYEFPDIQILATRLGHASKPNAAIGVTVIGPDLTRLREIGDQIRTLFASVPGVTHTFASLENGQPKFELKADQAEMEAAKFSNVALASQLNDGMSGAYGGSLFEETEEAPIRVRLATSPRRDLNMVRSVNLSNALPIGTSSFDSMSFNETAPWVPLSALGKLEVVPDVRSISRRDGQRSNTIQAFVPPESVISNLGVHYKEQLERIRQSLPAGYRFETGGEEENQQESLANVMAYVGLLAVIMIAALVVGMRSFRLMMIIVCVAVMSMGFGFAALAAFKIAFGFGAIVGLIGLTGVAINDSIVVLSAMHADADVRRGHVARAVDTVIDSTRHVLATSLTTMAGLLPLIVMGDVLHQPMAVAIGGGVLAATGLALVFSPAAYLLLMPRFRGFSTEPAVKP